MRARLSSDRGAGGNNKNSTIENGGIPHHDWVDPSVVPWMKSELAMQERVWGPNKNRGSLAFVHIPP